MGSRGALRSVTPGGHGAIRIACTVCAVLVLVGLPTLARAQLERVSLANDGSEANGFADQPDISADGRFVVFVSSATNLVEGDRNRENDIFVRDRAAATTVRVSVSSEGAEGNGQSDTPSISADGRFVAFTSSSSNLVDGDANGARWDVYVHDRHTGRTELVSVDPHDDWIRLDGISADGRFVVFRTGWRRSDGAVEGVTVVRDLQRGINELASEGLLVPRFSSGAPGGISSGSAAISSDGRFVFFASSGVFPAEGPTCVEGVYRIRSAFCAETRYVRDRERGTLEALPQSSGADGAFVGLYGAGGAFSADGRFLVAGTTLYGRERGSWEPVPLQIPNERPRLAIDLQAISADGRFVAYQASGAWGGPGQALLYDRRRGTAELLSESASGDVGSRPSVAIALSPDGRFAAFASYANNLVEADTNPERDIFVRDLRAARSRVPGGYAVFEKDGVELIARLGHPTDFEVLAIEPPAGPPFHGSFQGARFALIGSLSTRRLSPVPGLPGPQLLFSGSVDPHAISDETIGSVLAALRAPAGFFESWSALPSDGSQTSGLIASSDPRSLTRALGVPYPLPIRVDGQGRRTAVPAWSAAVERQRGSLLPLWVSELGVIEPLGEADLPVPSELFAVFSAGGWECIAHLGAHDALVEQPLSIALQQCPNTFAAGVCSTHFALVGTIDRDHERANLLFGAPLTESALLTEPQLQAAFVELADAEQSGFIDLLPGLSAGAGSAVELKAADPRSYQSRLASAGAGALPRLLAWPVDASTAALALHGAAAGPLVQAELLPRVELDANSPQVIHFRAAPRPGA